MSTEYQESPNRVVYNIDFDGTITTGDHNMPAPNLSVISKLTELYYSGNIIIIWTARQWTDASYLVGFLISNAIPFHGIQMAKGGSDYYIDDKMLDLKTFLSSEKLPKGE